MELIDVTDRYSGLFPGTAKGTMGGVKVLQCSECGTLLRPGQPHASLVPVPHQSLEALVVKVDAAELDARDGSHGEFA